ncbi:mannosyltransferase [Christiangramia fulva]|uniref:Mannosyltransferase n=1 Tax=Christiangramia fulva TaxID=2126553 RepID=A0A2R3Z2I2_9FLAO|nr:glycosyltransferase 87 family protein [Christiangramia fulva]AVR44474.1 mannosyltransferase [Christiangramia fulva]
MDFRTLKLYKIPIIFAVACAAFYLSFAYDLERTDFIKLTGLYLGLFFLSFQFIKMQKHNFWVLVALALIYRLLFLFSMPNLSQDFYRFIWDGRLIAEGWNPFAYIPKELYGNPDFHIPQATPLLNGMGNLSAGHYSNYPPVSQLIFAIAGFLFPGNLLGSVMSMRFFLILADMGTLFFGAKLLKELKLAEYRIFWYILNPFVIIELTGNLHFEGLMVFLLVLSLYLLLKKKWFYSAIFFGLAVSVKLLPLMFLPLFYQYFRKNSSLINLQLYYLIVGLVVALTFIPFYSAEVFSNFLQSVGLWFGKFEFNASIYYIVRWVGFQIKGYNIIETAGKILPLFTLAFILFLSFFRKNHTLRQLIENMLFAVTFYLLLSTTVHPWYLAVPLLLSIFSRFRFMIVWSGAVVLSYFAYSNPTYEENLWLVALEYLIVFGYLGYEVFHQRKFRLPE